ncbi:MAG: hypothetical protein MK165_10790 [Pirellulaceae bacterium]|nr:hypothetical protein [Pirellulaceae bacterium]
MLASDTKLLPAVGFLTVVEHPEHGFFGGFLVLNAMARPLEFHCTAPVRPNRAQEILYGTTLRPFLIGEHIGNALVQKAKTKIQLICTDLEPAIAVRNVNSTPVILLCSNSEEGESSTPVPRALRVDERHPEVPATSRPLVRFQLGTHEVAIPDAYEADRTAVEKCFKVCDGTLDLTEPFERIREAIEEAQKSAR